jgi:transcriptional regulator with XRE-family HTH domain
LLIANKRKLSENIKKLMAIRGVTLSDLSKEFKVSLSTLHRIVEGITKRPKYSIIVKIATFFNITINELIGENEIEWGKVGGLLNTIFIEGQKIPLCLWKVGRNKELYEAAKCENILITSPKDKKNFALKIKDTLISSLFPKGSILVCNPTIIPSNNSYVVALVAHSATMILRKLLIKSNGYYLAPVNSTLDLYKLEEEDEIVACVTQVSFSL